jgi:hypothetical protein
MTLEGVREVVLHKMCVQARRREGCDHEACEEAGDALRYLQAASPVVSDGLEGWFIPA